MYKPRVESCNKRIAEALKIKNMKQTDLCKLAKVPKSSLSLYLSGAYEPKQDRIYDIARVLGVSEAWLMGYDVPMERTQSATQDEKETLDLIRQTPEAKKLFSLILSLTEDEVKQVSDYLDYIISKRNK